MEATVNKQAAINGYEAFGAMDPEGAMKDISDAIEWQVGGENAMTGVYRGKDAVGGLWMKFVENGFRTMPVQFIAEGDQVVVLCDIELAGEASRSSDLLTYDADGKLVSFETFGGESLLDRTFPR